LLYYNNSEINVALLKKFIMAISKTWIIDGCISCGLCSDLCPDVFELQDVAVVKEGVDFNLYENQIKEAAGDCPVEVIKYE